MGTEMTKSDSLALLNIRPSDKLNPLRNDTHAVQFNTVMSEEPWVIRRCLFCILCLQVKLVEQGMGYLVFGGLMTATLAILPFCFHLAQRLGASNLGSLSPSEVVDMAVGPPDAKAYAFFFITTVQRVCLTGLFFFMMCVAERTYKQVIFFFFFFCEAAVVFFIIY